MQEDSRTGLGAPGMASDRLEQQRKLDDEQDNLLRLQYDYEFVQSLVNPQYIKKLITQGYLDDQRFLNYLAYLKYWKNPAYLKYLQMPRCLDILEMLLREEIRKELKENENFYLMLDG